MATASLTTSDSTLMETETPQRTTTERKPPVELKKWHGVASWSYDIQVEKCAICHNNIMDPCMNCQAEAIGAENANCPIEWGMCNHAFHNHCIARWVKTRPNCPMDQQPWVTQRIGN